MLLLMWGPAAAVLKEVLAVGGNGFLGCEQLLGDMEWNSA